MKAKWIAVAVASVIVVGVVAGFGGYTLGVKAGQTRAADIRANFLAARGAGTGQQGAGMPGQGAPGMPGVPAGGQNGGPQFNAANMAMGQVKGVDGNTVQLSTATEVLKVKIGDKTQIQKMGQGSLSDIQPGDRITVNTLPCPSWLSTEIAPPCASISSLAMASPNPVLTPLGDTSPR